MAGVASEPMGPDLGTEPLPRSRPTRQTKRLSSHRPRGMPMDRDESSSAAPSARSGGLPPVGPTCPAGRDQRRPATRSSATSHLAARVPDARERSANRDTPHRGPIASRLSGPWHAGQSELRVVQAAPPWLFSLLFHMTAAAGAGALDRAASRLRASAIDHDLCRNSGRSTGSRFAQGLDRTERCRRRS